MIDVLLVAPESGLSWVGVEVDTITSMDGLRVRLVRSPATVRSVTEKIDRHGVCDVLVFSTHGNENGIMLDDGLASTDDILMLVEMARCELTILNSCSSIAIANQIVKLTRCSVVATLEDQPDRRAWQVSTGILRELVHGGNPVSAFMRTARHDNNSVFLRSLID